MNCARTFIRMNLDPRDGIEGLAMQKIFHQSAPVTLPVTPAIAQGELALMGLLRAPDPIREDVLRTFGDDEEKATQFAIRWAWDHRRIQGMSQNQAAEHIAIASSHLCNILSGRKYLPPHKINAYEWTVGNRAVSMTIERFRNLREGQHTQQLAELIAANIVRAA